MKKGVVPRSGIDTDARWWGYSRTKGWIFGYKLHLTCTTGKIVVPLTVDVTTAMPFSIYFQTLQKIFLYILEIYGLFIYANWYSVPDNRMYVPLTSSYHHHQYSLYHLHCIWLLTPDMTIRNCMNIAKRL